MKRLYTFIGIALISFAVILGANRLLQSAVQNEVGLAAWQLRSDLATTGAWRRICGGNFTSVLDGLTLFTPTAGTLGDCEMLDVQAPQWIFNGSTWDRTRSASGDSLAGTGISAAGSMLFNGATWDRRRAAPATDTGNVGITGTGIFGANFTTPTNWERIRTSVDASNASLVGIPRFQLGIHTTAAASNPIVTADHASITDGGIGEFSQIVANYLFNGTNFDRARSVDATTLTETVSLGTTLVAPLSTWSEHDLPLAATQAIASKAAGAAGVRHVATSITACLLDTDSVDAQAVVLRDGATGAGTIIWAAQLGVSAVSGSQCITIPITFTGSAATAMTLEFSSAGSANSFETVTLTGYSVQ